jgi:hypothetical protein
MMSSNKMFSVLALVAPLAIGAFVVSPVTTMSEASAAEELPNLCESTRGVCEYTSMLAAPVLRQNVCYDNTTSTTTLMPSSGNCGTAGKPFYLLFGAVVDPITNLVIPYSPLADACEMGYCSIGLLDAGTIVTDTPVCCNPNTGECTAAEDGIACSVGDILWCENLEDHGDGSFTCHDE